MRRPPTPWGGTLPFLMASSEHGQTALLAIVRCKTIADAVRETAAGEKGKAYAVVAEGFAFGTRRPSPAKAGELSQQSPSYPLSESRQSGGGAALKPPFSECTVVL